jgi:acetate kinase
VHHREERQSEEGRLTRVLALNAGSSTVKGALWEIGPAETLVLSFAAERIGIPGGRVAVRGADGSTVLERPMPLADHEAAFAALFAALGGDGRIDGLDAVGHRIVHGGPRWSAPTLVTPAVTAALAELIPIDPDHAPQALAGIRAVERVRPDVPQVACFDTAFHRTMPAVARTYALPRRLADAGIVRYGFHGLSYEYVHGALRQLDGALADARVVIAHLGSGASVAALRGGRSVDTSMGFSPTAGLVMSTRSGDVDPGILLHLLQGEGMTPEALATMLAKESGLLGLSGTSGDMRDLLATEGTDAAAALAVEVFCYRARAYVGAYAATLGGLDALVFTGGIGEHAPAVRARVCAGLEHLGVVLDPAANLAGAPVVSGATSPVRVRVIPTNEELMLARHAAALVAARA